MIAASDAPAAIQSSADAVCDGTDDNVEIQAALDAGRPILLSEGTFWINGNSGQRVIMPSNSIIRGQGPQLTTVKLQPADLGNGTLFPILNSWGVIGTVGTDVARVSDVTIADLTIDGNEANMTSNGNANQGECIDTKYTDRLKVTNVHLINGNADGVDMDYSGGVLTNLTIKDCRGSGVHLSGGVPVAADYGASKWVVVQGLDVETCGWGLNRSGFDVTQDSAYSVFQGATIRDCHFGFDIAGNRCIVSNVICHDNTMRLQGDENILDGAVAIGGDNVGLSGMLIVLGAGNLVSNIRYSGFSGWTITGANNQMMNVYSDSFTAATVTSTATETRLTNVHTGVTPTTDAASGARWSQSQSDDGASEDNGMATIADGSSSVVVNHGVWASPTSIVVSPRSLEAIAVTARTATTFTVSRAGTTGALDFDWAASL